MLNWKSNFIITEVNLLSLIKKTNYCQNFSSMFVPYSWKVGLVKLKEKPQRKERKTKQNKITPSNNLHSHTVHGDWTNTWYSIQYSAILCIGTYWIFLTNAHAQNHTIVISQKSYSIIQFQMFILIKKKISSDFMLKVESL